MGSPPYTALLGGSFNPPHSGHFRMAIEVMEALRPAKLLLMPCAAPPHKPSHNLLPFDLRAQMLEAAVSHLPGMEVCRLEAERPGLSYTVDTLTLLRERDKHARFAFILGMDDFLQIPTWKNWEQLTRLTHFAVLPRGDCAPEHATKSIRAIWPGAAIAGSDILGQGLTYNLPEGGRIILLTQPRLDISSSLVRQRWLSGRSIDFLVPDAVQRLLEKHAEVIKDTWQKDDSAPRASSE